MNPKKYFKEDRNFSTFFDELRQKYIKTGKTTGIIKINNIEEQENLSLFLGKAIEKEVKLKEFEKRLIETFNISLHNLLMDYYNNSIQTNKQKKENSENERKTFFEEIINTQKNKKAELWLNEITNSSKISKKYNDNKNKLKIDLNYICKAINNLPKTGTPLNVFSANITNNSHYFDIETSSCSLFIDALSFFELVTINSREDKINLLSKYNLFVDEISNFVITYGLIDEKNKELELANKNYLPTMISLIHTEKYKNLKTKNNKLFIFENPIILHSILMNKLDCSVIITSGNPNSSLYRILDNLFDTVIYYNGDIDPEGILIVDKLISKYNVIPFG
ncbi:MAG: TIGR02679 domain-containing protein, partial [Bacilli bacterium]